MGVDPQIEASWKEVLADEFAAPYFADIKQQLIAKKKAGKTIYPPSQLIFNAFNLTPFEQVKVVILGQDPYHGPGQAHGLCFSVPDGIDPPPSLVNIYKEIVNDIGGEPPESGNLEHRAEQGVFLLNAILTVTAGRAASHRDIGWQQFTDAVIETISDKKEGVIFLLWGNFAKSKAQLIDGDKHVVLQAAHPSPLSAHKGFFGCQHFSATNQILQMQGKDPIQWLPE